MNMMKVGLVCVTVVTFLGAGTNANAQLPPDFPQLSILANTNPAPGCLFGSVNATGVPGYSNYFAILDNTGTNAILLNKTNSLGLLGCNGLFVSRVGTKGGPVIYVSKDSSFTSLFTNQAGNGFIAERDMCVMPNGHSLLTIVDQQIVDLSALGGSPTARVSGNVIQEIDVDNNVVFQWRILDHVPISDSYQDLTNPGSYAHVNSVWYDDLDGTIIISCRNTSQVLKINRSNGEIIWRLGGKHNDFTFTNAIPEGMPGHGEPAEFQVQHSAKRLPNGNITIFDNGYSDHSAPEWHFDRPYSRAAEYEIDEVNKIAKLVWQYRHTPDIITYNGGDVLHLESGHVMVNWGNDNTASPTPMMTEADENGQLACGVIPLQAGVSGSFTRMLWPLESTYQNVTKRELSLGNTYVFNEGTTNVSGVTMLNVTDIDADQYNSVTVSRQPFAPVLPRFPSKAPRVLPVRVQITQNLVNSLSTLISFDVSSFGIKYPTNTAVYYRETPGQGLFVALPTEYNSHVNPTRLETDFPGFGEFTLGFPDVAEVPYPPILITPKPEAEVNQDLPVSFFWTPKGFAASYHLQVSTNADFSTTVADLPDLTESRYINLGVAPGTRYYWRVNTLNDGGVGDWATNSFTTVPPMIQVTAPNGGEACRRGFPYTVRWNANIAEKVALDLYKAGVRIRILATNAPDALVYTWQVSSTNVPASDYAIRIRSTTNAALFDMSDAPFSIIDAPVLYPGSLTRLPDGRIQLGLTVPGATQATVLGSTNLSTWQELQTVPLTNGAAVFTDDTAANRPVTFYRLRVP
jgi:hypothetical protein